MEMFLQLFQYWFAVERDKLLTANLCGRNKHQRLFASTKRNDMKSLQIPWSTEIDNKIEHFLQINTLSTI